MRTRNATDLGLNLDRFPAPSRPADVDWIFIQGPPGWIFEEHARRYLKLGPCPCCRGRLSGEGAATARDPLDGGPIRRRGPGQLYCTGCDESTLDGRVKFPGLPVDYAPNPDWAAEPTIYTPDPALAGGVDSRPAKIRRGVARSRTRKAG